LDKDYFIVDFYDDVYRNERISVCLFHLKSTLQPFTIPARLKESNRQKLGDLSLCFLSGGLHCRV